MAYLSTNIVIGGEAGQGLVTVGDFLARALVRAGYEVVVTQDYQSRIRGGHNTYAIRVALDPVQAPTEAIDLLVALSPKTLDACSGRLKERALILADEAIDVGQLPAMRIPYKALIPKPLYENTAALGVLSTALCLDGGFFEQLIRDDFHKKGDEVVNANLKVFRDAAQWAKGQSVVFSCLPPPERTEKRLFMHGNEAIALGALAAGVNFLSFYPMTPGTSVAQGIIDKAEALGVVVEQCEDEIAAMNMALGASYAGATALVPTSGGGFALMVEAVSLAGMIETPVVCVVAQRPGPATGLPTRTEQADVNLVLYAGHGEFPRAVYTPGTPEQCFHLTHKAVDAAERSQGPVFVLTDQFQADSYRAVKPFDLDSLPETAKPGLDAPDAASYRRYALTDSGVSPRLVPGFSKALVVVDSDEHTEDGHLTEDLDVRVRMQDKRLRKLEVLRQMAVPPERYGPAGADVLFVCFGSTIGACCEAAHDLSEKGVKAGVLHFSQVYPLQKDKVVELLASGKKLICVEGNSTGQFAALLQLETGVAIPHKILRYDGLPFTANYILERMPA